MSHLYPIHKILLLTSALFLLLLAACVAPQTNLPRTDEPIFLPALGPTLTPTQTPTPSPADYIQKGQPVTLTQAGFSFRPVTAWDATGQPLTLVVTNDHARLSNTEESLYFNLSAEPADTAQSTQACLDRVILRVRQDVPDLAVSAGQPRLMAGLEGLSTQISGYLLSQKMSGLLSVVFTQERCFSLLSLATGADATNLWLTYGQAIDVALLADLTWLDPSAQTTPVICVISTDPTYGTDPNNPIRVGNQAQYDAFQREELYLSTLRGPAGEEIMFTRLAPRFNDAEEIVDVYEIRYNDSMKPTTLFFDTARYEPPLAIAGFTCEAAFPIVAP